PLGRNVARDKKWDVLVVHRRRCIGTAAAKVSRSSVCYAGAAAEELHPLRDYLSAIALAAPVLGLVLASLQAALDIALPAFLEILPAELGLFAIDDYVMPVRPLLPGTLSVGVGIARGEREISHRLARGNVTHFG